MRNWIIGAAAMLAIAAPGVAAAQTGGYVGAVYSNTDVDGFDDADAYGVEGAAAFAGSGSIVFEVDASVVDSDSSDTGVGLVGHVYSRNDSHLFGAFAGVSDSDDSTTWTAGLEASKFYTNWTLAGAVGYGDNDDANANGWGANAEARYFVHDNFRLQGNIGWANVDAPGGDEDVLSYGVGGEYQLAEVPVSIAAGYGRTEFDESDVEADTVSVAVRYNWGGSLRDRDRNGASQGSITNAAFVF